MRNSGKGFTLAELLIALAILGVIATFTIPKVLQASGNGQNTAIAKEAASMVSGAFQAYQLDNSLASGTTAGAFTSYLNYVSVDTATSYTESHASDSALNACSATLRCLKLHNGGILQYDTAMSFGGTSTTNAIYFNLDPDANGTRGRITFCQFYNGRLTTGGADTTNCVVGNVAGETLSLQATDPDYLSNWN